MKICDNCKKEFPTKITVDGKRKGLHNRRFCLDCSPYKQHNTLRNLTPKSLTERKCSLCKEIKPIDEFYKRKNGRPGEYPWCRSCFIVSIKKKQKNLKERCVQYKGGCCNFCGYNKTNVALEFHHLDPNEKDFGISSHKTRNWEKLKIELDKCILVCANCHREIHAGLINLSASGRI